MFICWTAVSKVMCWEPMLCICENWQQKYIFILKLGQDHLTVKGVSSSLWIWQFLLYCGLHPNAGEVLPNHHHGNAKLEMKNMWSFKAELDVFRNCFQWLVTKQCCLKKSIWANPAQSSSPPGFIQMKNQKPGFTNLPAKVIHRCHGHRHLNEGETLLQS